MSMASLKRLAGRSTHHIYAKVTHIEIGPHSENLKKNPSRGAFSPAQYSFDPYTGRKLVLGKEKRVVNSWYSNPLVSLFFS